MSRSPVALGLCQFLYMVVAAVGIAFNALVGKALASSPAMATLPFFFMMAGTALLTLLMPKILDFLGYRKVFAIGALAGVVSGALSIFALEFKLFSVFCLAGLLMGIYQASSLYYRFAAAEAVALPQKSSAIAWVLSGGVLAALCGPILGAYGLHLFTLEYAGCYLIAGISAALALPIILKGPLVHRQHSSNPGSTLKNIPLNAYAAILFCLGGYAAMLFIMLATPLAMTGCGFHAKDSASVIQWHLLGMFAPSFLTGRLIAYWGPTKVAVAGILILIGGCSVGLVGQQLSLFHFALLIVGVGWNFMYMGGSTLLSQIPDATTRGKLQSINEFFTFITITLISGITGWLYESLGWQVVLDIAIVFLIAVGIAVIVSLLMARLYVRSKNKSVTEIV